MKSEKEYSGWAGQILRVNLTEMKCRIEPIDPYLSYLGGRGVSDWILFNESEPSVAPLDADSIIALGAGPLVGTFAPAAGRLNISTKSVLTRGVSTANVGGHFGAELKFAGFDQIVIEGKAPFPVYLWVQDGRAEIRKACELWGKTTWQTEEAIRKELQNQKIRVAAIGPAGENLCAQACVIVDKARAAGWGGCGAVFGSKKLKAIAVRGKMPLKIFDPEGLWACTLALRERIARSRAFHVLTRYGTHGAYGVGGPLGTTPQGVRNHQDEYWPAEKGMHLREIVFREKWEVGRTACFSCPGSCTHLYRFQGRNSGSLLVEGVHTNTVRGLGSNLDITDPEAVLRGQALINQLGLNTDGVSSVLGWAFEAYEKGLLTREDTDGLELRWGNGQAMLMLLERLAYRKGLGDLLARGVKEASQILGRGSDAFAMHVKGQEMNEQTVRSHKGWALGIFTSTRGSGHLNGASLIERLGMEPEQAKALFGTEAVARPESYEGKGRATAWFESFKALVDSLGICYYVTLWIDMELLGLEGMSMLLHKATGQKIEPDELLTIGERVYNIEKAFNTLHAGFTRQDDVGPKRFYETPISGGPFAGVSLDLKAYNAMLDEYYLAHGWDLASGWQTVSCLDRLGLEDVKRRLGEAGKLIRG